MLLGPRFGNEHAWHPGVTEARRLELEEDILRRCGFAEAELVIYEPDDEGEPRQVVPRAFMGMQ